MGSGSIDIEVTCSSQKMSNRVQAFVQQSGTGGEDKEGRRVTALQP